MAQNIEEVNVNNESVLLSDANDRNPQITEETWNTVQSGSTKRRLAPQWTLSRQDLGVDSPRNKAAAQEVAKKKVLRFTKDELLSFRKPTKVLSEMIDLTDIISVPPLTPMSHEPFDPDDFTRIWNADRAVVNAGRGRGRGRGKSSGRDEDGCDEVQGTEGHWSRGQGNDDGALWDDVADASVATGGNFDLADFAAAALQFQVTTKDLGLGHIANEGGLIVNKEDAMERLIREQMEMDELEAQENEDEDGVPDWAQDEQSTLFQVPEAPIVDSNVDSTSKRSLLLETLNVKIPSNGDSFPPTEEEGILIQEKVMSEVVTGNSIPQSIALANSLSFTSHDRSRDSIPRHDILSSVFEHNPGIVGLGLPGHVSAITVDEWLYLDPQNNVQGPFSSKSMQRWHDAGYFKLELPIKLQQWTRFHPLGVVFPTPSVAFTELPIEPRILPLNESLDRRAILIDQQHRQALVGQQNHQQQVDFVEHQRRMEEAAEQLKLRELDKRRQLQSDDRILTVKQHHQDHGLPHLTSSQRKDSIEHYEPNDQSFLARDAAQYWEPPTATTTTDGGSTASQMKEETDKLDEKASAGNNATPSLSTAAWGTSGQVANMPQTLSLLQIQIDEEQQSSVAPSAMSMQLKSLLGVTSQPDTSTAAWKTTQSTDVRASGALSMRESIQIEEQKEYVRQQQLRQHQEKVVLAHREQEMAGKQENPVLSSVAKWANKTGSPKAKASLRDIMDMESRTEEILETNGDSKPRVAPGSWAAKLGVGSPGASLPRGPPPSSTTTRTNSSNVLASLTAGKGAGDGESQDSQNRGLSVHVKYAVQVTSSTPSQPMKGQKVKSNDFGGKGMSQDMAEWCSSSIKRINGSDDITLLQFCMSLESGVEIREYLAAYLGSTPQVSQFATEFIRRKEGGLISTTSSAQTGVIRVPTPAVVPTNADKKNAKKKKTKSSE